MEKSSRANVADPHLTIDNFDAAPRQWTKAYVTAKAILDHPFDSAQHLAARIGVSYDNVRLIASQYNLKVGAAKSLDLSSENQAWLIGASKRFGLTPSEFLDVVVTDARLDDAADDLAGP